MSLRSMTFRVTLLATMATLYVPGLMAQTTAPGRIVQVVNPYPTQLGLAADQQAPTTTTPVTVTADLTKTPTPSTLAPTGYVTFAVTPPNGPVQAYVEALSANGTASLSPSLAMGANKIFAYYGGDQNYSPASSTAAITVAPPTTPDFDFAVPAVVVQSGQSYNGNITVQPMNGFSGEVSFTPGTLPQGVNFNFAAPTVKIASATSQTTTTSLPVVGFTLSTTATTVTAMSGLFLFYALGLRRRRKVFIAVAVLAASSLVLLTGCASNRFLQTDGTPVGTYQIPITGTSGSLSHTHYLTLTIKNGANPD
jgi:hypothetical protein